jgi:hypothetical protein
VGGWAEVAKMARQFEVRYCLRCPPSDRGPYNVPFDDYPVHVYCVCLGGKWSGEWQISKNFGACGASGNFFSKFRETLRHPKVKPNRHPVMRSVCRPARAPGARTRILLRMPRPGQGARRADTDIAPTEPKAPSACEFLRRSGSVPTVGLSNIDAYERI